MKLKFKHQKFQADAAKAVVDVFKGQPYSIPTYMIDKGNGNHQIEVNEEDDFTGFSNHKIEINDNIILENIQKIQRMNNIKPSDKIEGRYNLTVSMETGVGKTYTYIKTMYELNKTYGWSKFIIVVPSIAIREGVYKSFQVTSEHFAEEYGKKIRFFIYNSNRLSDIDRFASDSSINVMIINYQAFNATGENARSEEGRKIYRQLDEFRSRRPIDVIKKTNPILIIDEPQSVEGKKTKEKLKDFEPLMTLRYSATHKSDSIYNLVYSLDAMEAYNKRLVKKIAVKGISKSGSSFTNSFVYLESINLSKAAPTANISFDYKGKTGIKKITKKVSEGFNLYDISGGLEEYKNNYVIKSINGRDNSIEFLNGLKLYTGDIVGEVEEEEIRRIQIRETILSHIERERQLFYKGIKVLSLFFIDEVAKYKKYGEGGNPINGVYADIFEQEYNSVVNSLKSEIKDNDYLNYLEFLNADETHAGYFSIDKKGKMVDGKINKKENMSDDIDAYDLIMKNKELLLDRNPKKSPVRFIFSHSALREGWDNPNVFQICTLKQSSSEVRKRQEVGRGLRLCVNENGERMDVGVLGNDIFNVNVLTIIASESYDDFSKALQSEISEVIADRPVKVEADLFVGKVIKDDKGLEQIIDRDIADAIYFDMIQNGYVDKKGKLTDKYYEDKSNSEIKLADEVADCYDDVLNIIDSIYDDNIMQPENARSNNVELKLDDDKLAMPEFKELWNRINSKSVYVVDFDSDELIDKAIKSIDKKLDISKIYYKVEKGEMEEIKSKESLENGSSFIKEESITYTSESLKNSGVKYDLIGKLVEETGLRRADIIKILKGIEETSFNKFKENPEEFILKVGKLINEEKATCVIEHIIYDILDEKYDKDIFTDVTMKGKLNKNAIKAKKHLYDHLIYDSTNERDFANELDTSTDVAVYVKLPKGFYISTPVGKYNPDWAISFYEGNIKHIYFVAETKGSMSSMQLREIEKSKIECAKKHFNAISSECLKYDVVDSYKALMDKVMK